MRIDPGLWRELERWAADELRSVNGQIEFIVREALRRRGVGSHPERRPERGPENGPEQGSQHGPDAENAAAAAPAAGTAASPDQ